MRALIRDTNKEVATAVIRSPTTENEVVKFAANRALSKGIIAVISNTKEWVKLYSIELNLILNPKTQLATAMKFLPFLQDKDIRNVDRSKAIPSALVTAAKNSPRPANAVSQFD